MGARLRLPYRSYRQSLARYADMGGPQRAPPPKYVESGILEYVVR